MLDLKEVGFSGSSVIVSQELVLWSSGAFVFGSEAFFKFSIQFPGNITEDLLMAEANDTFDTFSALMPHGLSFSTSCAGFLSSHFAVALTCLVAGGALAVSIDFTFFFFLPVLCLG